MGTRGFQQDMVGKPVNAELYKLPDGQVRASHVRVLRQVIENAQNDEGMPALAGGDEENIKKSWSSLRF